MPENSIAKDPEATASSSAPINLRWRIVDGKIPLRERHIRSLDPLDLPAPLIAWIRERLEWAVDNLLYAGKEGVLCLAIDPQKDVVVSLENVRDCPQLISKNLLSDNDAIIGVHTDGTPLEGVVFIEREEKLFASATELTSASATLTAQLASTLGFDLEVAPLSRASLESADAIFLISDEFGYVPITKDEEHVISGEPTNKKAPAAPYAAKLAACLEKVFPQKSFRA